MGAKDSSSVGDLLKQVYAAHNSVKGGLQSQVSKLKAKIAHLESVIAKCSLCSECGNQLIKLQNDAVITVSQPKNVNSNQKISNKRLKTNNDDTKANAECTPVKKSPPRLSMTETPSLFDESWEAVPAKSAAKETPKRKSPISASGCQNSPIKLDKTSTKLKQVTLDKSFCFAVENKQNELRDISVNSDLSPSLLAKAPGNEFTQDLISDPSEFQIFPSRNTGKTEKINVGFKFHAEVTRNREDRAKLDGFGCHQCKEYYGNLNLTEEELKKRMNNCSRHRDNHVPSNTPEHFWDVDFPTTQESKNRGEITNTQYRPLQTRRKRLVDLLS
uniref:DNA endonuclease activator Ctp1 C-terminal domain-containing protein n=1 Tax=Strigamia maritima TaxID=126957 RepID=T1JFB5_STRMM